METRPSQTLQIMQRFNQAFVQHDASLLDGLIAEDCVMESVEPAPEGTRYVGRKACLEFWQKLANNRDGAFADEDIFAIGEHAEGAAVVFLFSLSELLESWSVGRARRAIQALMQLAPETALVRRDGNIREVSASEVAVGETIFVKSGQKVPLDGTILKGSSAIDQAPITGESMPRPHSTNAVTAPSATLMTVIVPM